MSKSETNPNQEAQDESSDVLDVALKAKELQKVLLTLDRTSMYMSKKKLAETYGLKEREIVQCWQDVKELSNNSSSKEEEETHPLLINPEPWPEPVKLSDVIADVERMFRRFVIFKTRPQALACAVWTVATWFIEEIQYTPYILITAPMKQCGKSQLLTCMSKLARRAILASSISPSAVYRVIEMYQPTLFIDEVDTFLKGNPELSGIINCGIEKEQASVWRCENNNNKQEARAFNCFGFKVLCGINSKTISETVTDRSIVIELRRRNPGEVIERRRDIPDVEWIDLRRKCYTAFLQHKEQLRAARPVFPTGMGDREADKWESLFALVDLAGDQELSKQVRDCAIHLAVRDQVDVSETYELLSDIRDILEKDYGNREEVLTQDLIAKLTEDNELLWGTYNKGAPMTPNQLSKKLRTFCLYPKQIRSLRNRRGYKKSEIAQVIEQYLTKKEQKESES